MEPKWWKHGVPSASCRQAGCPLSHLRSRAKWSRGQSPEAGDGGSCNQAIAAIAAIAIAVACWQWTSQRKPWKVLFLQPYGSRIFFALNMPIIFYTYICDADDHGWLHHVHCGSIANTCVLRQVPILGPKNRTSGPAGSGGTSSVAIYMCPGQSWNLHLYPTNSRFVSQIQPLNRDSRIHHGFFQWKVEISWSALTSWPWHIIDRHTSGKMLGHPHTSGPRTVAYGAA